MVDLAQEMTQAVTDVRQPHLERLIDLGVTSEGFGELGYSQEVIGIAHIMPTQNGLYELSNEGFPAALMPVYERQGLVDIVAFRTEKPDAWLWRHGNGVYLGWEYLEPNGSNDPVMVFETPLEWLRNVGKGICILDWSAPDYEVERLHYAHTFVTPNAVLATRLKRLVNRARKLPTISVIKSNHERTA